ncbi:Crp/Fnr family transcriptional regulator [Flavobacterium sp. IB48]|uniref:Crp/Fnr family transcriptional regulator n=1 Tax=Flavobacterium sp. IB48 TaxID=2779375 RepID=UPI0018E8AE65|nr:Crp/Fnr family transcriptional regulator [Flavobacterium sp. IB48]
MSNPEDKLVLNNFFHSLFPIEKEIVEKITKNFTPFKLEKNSILLDKETVSTKTYFLEKGYMASFILNEDNDEIITNIFTAPCFVNDFLSFFKKEPTKETFQTITDCTFWETDLETVQDNFHSISQFREFSRLLFVINYHKLNDRLIEMVSQKAETRYLKLLKQRPDIFKHVPLKIIASYLGITDTSLSRIRRDTSHF